MKETICNNVSIILVKQIHYITEKKPTKLLLAYITQCYDNGRGGLFV